MKLNIFSTSVRVFAVLCLAVCPAFARAATYNLPTGGNTLVGGYAVVTPGPENTLLDLARYYGLGQQEIALANPGVSLWVPGENTPIVLPRVFILPPKPWQGIIINIPQRRLFYFPKPRAGKPAQVITLPVSIAREGWSTPLGNTRVTGKYEDPAWFVPPSIRAEHIAMGEKNFPNYFPPGPDNPMGMLAIQTGFDGIFIHGTNKPWALGERVSHGCLHLYPEDAAKLFPLVQTGTPVRVVNEPTPVGYRNGHVYMQSFPVIKEYGVPGSLEQHAIHAYSRLMADLSNHGVSVAALDAERLSQQVKTSTSIVMPITQGAVDTSKRIANLPVKPHEAPPYTTEANNAKVPDALRE